MTPRDPEKWAERKAAEWDTEIQREFPTLEEYRSAVEVLAAFFQTAAETLPGQGEESTE